VQVVNRNEPEAFKTARELLENFARNELGLAAVALPPEKLLELARDAVLLGQKLFAEREVRYENLSRAIRAFEEAQWYLETLEPKPDYYGSAVSGLEECKRALQESGWTTHRFQADRAVKLRDWAGAARHLRIICELVPDRGDERHAQAQPSCWMWKGGGTMSTANPPAPAGPGSRWPWPRRGAESTQVRINTTPPDALLFVDGVARDRSPTTLAGLAPGTPPARGAAPRLPRGPPEFLPAGRAEAGPGPETLEELRGLVLVHSESHRRRGPCRPGLPGPHAPAAARLPARQAPRATISLQGYIAKDLDVEVNDRIPQKLQADLVADSATIRTSPRSRPGAEVFINGAAAGARRCASNACPAATARGGAAPGRPRGVHREAAAQGGRIGRGGGAPCRAARQPHRADPARQGARVCG
jgi:hypothetical protein